MYRIPRHFIECLWISYFTGNIYTTRLLYFTKLMGFICSAGINGKVELVLGTNQLLVFKFKKDEKRSYISPDQTQPYSVLLFN